MNIVLFLNETFTVINNVGRIFVRNRIFILNTYRISVSITMKHYTIHSYTTKIN